MALAIINTPEAKRKIRSALQDISDVKTKQEAGRDTIKQIIADLSEEYEIDKKQLRKMANVYHKQNFGQATTENRDFEILYETVTGEPAGFDAGEEDQNHDAD